MSLSFNSSVSFLIEWGFGIKFNLFAEKYCFENWVRNYYFENWIRNEYFRIDTCIESTEIVIE